MSRFHAMIPVIILASLVCAGCNGDSRQSKRHLPVVEPDKGGPGQKAITGTLVLRTTAASGDASAYQFYANGKLLVADRKQNLLFFGSRQRAPQAEKREWTVPLPVGNYKVEVCIFYEKSGQFPFAFQGQNLEIAAAAKGMAEFDVSWREGRDPTGWSGGLEDHIRRASALIGDFSVDFIPFKQAMEAMQVHLPSEPLLVIPFPKELGGSREFDEHQVRCLCKWLRAKYALPTSEINYEFQAKVQADLDPTQANKAYYRLVQELSRTWTDQRTQLNRIGDEINRFETTVARELNRIANLNLAKP